MSEETTSATVESGKRPGLLTVLCILTFIGSGLATLFSLLATIGMGSLMETVSYTHLTLPTNREV